MANSQPLSSKACGLVFILNGGWRHLQGKMTVLYWGHLCYCFPPQGSVLFLAIVWAAWGCNVPWAFQSTVGEMSLPTNGWLYCGYWELPGFSNAFPLLQSKRFGVFLCNLSMHSKKNDTKVPMQKPLLKRRAVIRTPSPVQVSAVSLQAGRQGLVGPLPATAQCLGSRQPVVPSTVSLALKRDESLRAGSNRSHLQMRRATAVCPTKNRFLELSLAEGEGQPCSLWETLSSLLPHSQRSPPGVLAHKHAHSPPVLPWLLCVCRFPLLPPFALFSLRATQCSAVFFLDGNFFLQTGQNELWHVFKSNKDKN